MKNENFKIENLACKMLDLLDELKNAENTLDDEAFKRKIQYAKTASDVAKIVLDCKKEETERAKIVLQLSNGNQNEFTEPIKKLLT